jgi:hypothetical protein
VHARFLAAWCIHEFDATGKLPVMDSSAINHVFKYLIHHHSDGEKELAAVGGKLVDPSPKIETKALYKKLDAVWAIVKDDFQQGLGLPYINTTTWSNTFLYLSTSFETNIKLHFSVCTFFYFFLFKNSNQSF